MLRIKRRPGRLCLIAATSSTFLALLASPQPQAEIIAGRPDAIVCSVKDPTGVLPWAQLVYYVSARTTDGRTLYKTLTSDPVVILVRDDGVVDGQNLADCAGRSIDELFAEGRAFMLTPPRARAEPESP
ncbi:MAG: hypothetical protein AAGA95_00425 [Pseudomonadota bacterium]